MSRQGSRNTSRTAQSGGYGQQNIRSSQPVSGQRLQGNVNISTLSRQPPVPVTRQTQSSQISSGKSLQGGLNTGAIGRQSTTQQPTGLQSVSQQSIDPQPMGQLSTPPFPQSSQNAQLFPVQKTSGQGTQSVFIPNQQIQQIQQGQLQSTTVPRPQSSRTVLDRACVANYLTKNTNRYIEPGETLAVLDSCVVQRSQVGYTEGFGNTDFCDTSVTNMIIFLLLIMIVYYLLFHRCSDQNN